MLLSCSSIGVGRKVEQVADHSFPEAGPMVAKGSLKLEILENVTTLTDIRELDEKQILCRGEISTPTPGTFFYQETIKDFYFTGNIITKEKNTFIELPFVVGATNNNGRGEKAVNFRFAWLSAKKAGIKEKNFKIDYKPAIDTDDYIIPRYPAELAVIKVSNRSYRLFAVYEPLYETVPFSGKGPSTNPLRNMEDGSAQLKNNNQKYQIVNSEGKAIAEVHNHTYRIFDSGDPVTTDDGIFCAGLIYTIINVANILESSERWYK